MSDRVREDGYTLSMLAGFWLAAVVNLAGEASGIDVLSMITKPFLMPFLYFWTWQVLGRPKPRAGRWLLAGLVAAWVGDIALMLGGPDEGRAYFLAGLGAFLVMQVCYIVAFAAVPGGGLLQRSWWLALPFALYWLVATLLMDPQGLRVPVILYSIVLVTMSAAALDLAGRFPRSQVWPLFTGSVLFVLSDTLIGLGAFGSLDAGRLHGFAVMLTYVVAQFLIVTRFVRGLILREE